MNKFTYDDRVKVKEDAPALFRPGQKAWVVLVVSTKDRVGAYFDQFPPGTVYSIEFEDGEAVEIHESLLEFHS